MDPARVTIPEFASPSAMSVHAITVWPRGLSTSLKLGDDPRWDGWN